MSSQSKPSAKAADSTDMNSPQQRAKVKQLQELFPSWSNDDLLSLLNEVQGDVDFAATRISEGHAEQWGSVPRKKDKKSTNPAIQSKDSFGTRGDSRGVRGGRGGRGGGPAARGGASTRGGRGTGRGGHRDTNGHVPSAASAAPAAWNSETPTDWGNAWGSEDKTAKVEAPKDDLGAWGTDTSTVAELTPSAPTSVSVASTAGAAADVPETAKSPPMPKPQKTPMTSKLSWAQIAKPVAKPTPPPPPPAPAVAPPPPVISQPPLENPQDSVATEPAFNEEAPTTAGSPVWDSEPGTSAEAPPDLQTNGWTTAENPLSTEEHEVTAQPEAVSVPALEAEPTQVQQSYTVSPLPAQLQQQQMDLAAPKPLEPISNSRAGVSVNRNHPRYKTDQAVVLPSSFGTHLEKIGMQFGSLSLNGEGTDEIVESNTLTTPSAIAPTGLSPEPSRPEATGSHPDGLPISALPAQPVAATTASLFSAIPQQAQQQQVQPQSHQPQSHSPAASSTHPASSSTPSVSTTATSPFGHQQASLSGSALLGQSQAQIAQQSPGLPQQLPPHLQPQPQQQQYGGHQQGFSHLDQLQHQSPAGLGNQQTLPQQLHQPQSLLGHSSYFRSGEAPYFNAPTPPVGGGQDSGYGSFQGLNQQQQLAGFGGNDYGYNDGRGSFYDSYNQQGGFPNRTNLSHEDIKGLGAQLPSSASGGPQSQGGQQQQQSYQPAPYYPYYPQNQFYGSPYNPGYGVPQSFVKYPTMFQQPGVPGGQNTPSVGKPPNSAAGSLGSQGQSNPYSGSMYGGQQDYDGGIGYQGHHQQQSHLGSGLQGGEYGKQLYGAGTGAGQGGMQGFMGLGSAAGQSAASPGGAQLSAQRGSPEAAYKYGQGKSDVGASGGAASGQPQGRAGGVQQAQQGFYGNRYAAGNPAGQPGQQNQTQGYPQSGPDGFYSYQARQAQQQQGYWQ